MVVPEEELVTGKYHLYSVEYIINLFDLPVNSYAKEKLILANKGQSQIKQCLHSLYIQSLLSGHPSGAMVINGNGSDFLDENPVFGSGEILDGKKRALSLSMFFNNELAIFDDIWFKDLNVGERLRFLRKSIPTFEFECSKKAKDSWFSLHHAMIMF